MTINAPELRRVARPSHWSGFHHVDRRAGHSPQRFGASPGREIVRRHREVPGLSRGPDRGRGTGVEECHNRIVASGLPPDPSGHLDITHLPHPAVPLTSRHHLAFDALPAPPAGDLERHGADVPGFTKNIVSDLDSLTGDSHGQGYRRSQQFVRPRTMCSSLAPAVFVERPSGSPRVAPSPGCPKPLRRTSADLPDFGIDRLDDRLSQFLNLTRSGSQTWPLLVARSATVRPRAPDRGGARSCRRRVVPIQTLADHRRSSPATASSSSEALLPETPIAPMISPALFVIRTPPGNEISLRSSAQCRTAGGRAVKAPRSRRRPC